LSVFLVIEEKTIEQINIESNPKNEKNQDFLSNSLKLILSCLKKEL
jgi:hypothetical protein